MASIVVVVHIRGSRDSISSGARGIGTGFGRCQTRAAVSIYFAELSDRQIESFPQQELSRIFVATLVPPSKNFESTKSSVVGVSM